MDSVVLDIIKITASSSLGGVITALAAWPVRGLVGKPGGSDPVVPLPKSRSASVVSLALIGAILFGLAGYFLVRPTFLSACPRFASTNATITSPTDGSAVPQSVIVRGKACNIPQDKELWVIVVAQGVAGFYPQQDKITVANDGSWTTNAFLGDSPSTGSGTGFVLYTALADQGGIAAIQSYFAEAPNFTPLDPLPAGIQLLSQVEVRRT